MILWRAQLINESARNYPTIEVAVSDSRKRKAKADNQRDKTIKAAPPTPRKVGALDGSCLVATYVHEKVSYGE